MAHYAFLNENNIVTNVIVGIDEGGEEDWEKNYGELFGQTCKRTSYNTRMGVHENGGTPFRGNYASIGFTYNEELDAFIPPKPFDSWILNEEIYNWEPPIPIPDDGKSYYWNDEEYQTTGNGWFLISETINT